MTEEEFLILKSPEARKLIGENMDADPTKLALTLKCESTLSRAVCGQVKYLQRSQAKLPSYYAAGCIIHPLAYEQCSSEAAAAAKNYSGKLCIDLTCGLGVDSFHFSKNFGRVISVEKKRVLAEIAGYNFTLLYAENISVVNRAAEEFLASYRGEKASLIFADPARRGSRGEKLVMAEDCSPDVVSLMPLMLEKAEKALIKLSPMFDVEEAMNVFSPYVSKVKTVSVRGECKELLVELSKDSEESVVEIDIIGGKRYVFRKEDIGKKRNDVIAPESLAGKYLLIPDAGFYKNRLVAALFEKYFPQSGAAIASENGFCFADSIPEGFPGRAFHIEEIAEYRPKRLKKRMKEDGVKRINVLRRDFPSPSAEICKSLGVAEGGSANLAFTKIGAKAFVLLLGNK